MSLTNAAPDLGREIIRLTGERDRALRQLECSQQAMITMSDSHKVKLDEIRARIDVIGLAALGLRENAEILSPNSYRALGVALADLRKILD